MAEQNEFKVVVVGYGSWGRQCHCYLIGLTPDLRLHGVVARKVELQERARTEQGPDCRIYGTPEEAFADPDVDVIVLATPNYTHESLAVAALKAGKHVVTDKVMCLSLDECNRMIETANESGKILTVFQNRRLDGDFLTVRHLMQSGDLGTVRWIEMAWQGLGSWGGWRGQAEKGGGRLYDLGAHLLDQLLVLFPEPIESVYARITHDFENTDVESEALVVVQFAGGQTGICDLSSRTAISKPRFYVKGDIATFQKFGLDPQEDALRAGHIETAQESPEAYGQLKSKTRDERIPTLPGRWRTYYENLADALAHPESTTPLVTLPEARRVVAVMEAARRSARERSVIAFDGDEAIK